MKIKISITGPKGSVEIEVDESGCNFAAAGGYVECVDGAVKAAAEAYKKLKGKGQKND